MASLALRHGLTTTLRGAYTPSTLSRVFPLLLRNGSAPSGVIPRRGLDLRLQSTVASQLAQKSSSLPFPPVGPRPTEEQSESALESEDEQVPFSSIRDVVAPETYKALTVRPFNHTHMTPVQSTVLPLLPDLALPYDPSVSGTECKDRPVRDLLVRAKTGTGKTLGFLVPAIEARIKSIEEHVKATIADSGLTPDKGLIARATKTFTRTRVGTLIISPTRELATQIATEAVKLAHHHPGFEVRLFVGGESKRYQMRDWTKGRRDIVVATPGRLRDLLTSEPSVAEGLKHTQTLVLDEADTLLDMGFRDDIEAIIDYLPPTPERQTFLFSATVSPAIRQIARSTLDTNHTYINTVSETTSPVHAHVPQFHTVLPSAKEQIPHVLRLLAHDQLTNPGKSKTIVFLPTTKMTQLFATLIRELSRTCLPAGRETEVYEIHSKRPQESRSKTSNAFRRDQSGASILVTSDVSARGVDYPGVTRVIQVGVPSAAEQYIHRVGRTGRAGTSGRGDLVLLPWEVGFLSWQLTNVPLKPATIQELKSEVASLASKHDEDPSAFFDGVPSPGGRNRLARWRGPVAPLVETIPKEVENLLTDVEEEAVKETFASLLGYYITQSQELRTSKGSIIDGCKDWATEGLGLPTPPYVSPEFLKRIGYTDDSKRAGRRDRRSSFGLRTEPHWMGRGQQRLKERANEGSRWSWGSPRLEEDDDSGRRPRRSSRYERDNRDVDGDRQQEFGSGGRGFNGGGRSFSRGYGGGFRGSKTQDGPSYGIRRSEETNDRF